jgi:hypothetical protein
LVDLPNVSGLLSSLLKKAMDQRDGTVAERLILRLSERSNLLLTEEEPRVWSFLLLDYSLRHEQFRQTPSGWYHGVLLPGRAGTTRVRQIVSKEVTDEVCKNAFRETSNAKGGASIYE